MKMSAILKKAMLCLLCLAVIVPCVVDTAQAASLGLSFSIPVEGGGSLYIDWDDVPDASYYHYSLRNLTTGESIVSNAYTDVSAAWIDNDWFAGDQYRVWVGCCRKSEEGQPNDLWAYKEQGSFTVAEKAGCQHKKTKKVNSHGVYREEECTPEYHILYEVYDLACASCDKIMERDLSRSLGKEEHNFSSKGVCLTCHYAGKICTHDLTQKSDTRRTEYVAEDADSHTRYKYFDLICRSCSAVIPERLTDGPDARRDVRTGMKHDFTNGVCTDCGYKQAAKLSVSVSRGQSSAYVGGVISATASISGGSGNYTVYWSVYCNGVCLNNDVNNSWIADSMRSVSYTADREGQWTFSAYVVDSQGAAVTTGSGSISVQAAPCSHSYQTTERRDLLTYENLNDSNHHIVRTYESVCQHCGTLKDAWPEKTLEAHSFGSSGQCVCGKVKPQGCIHDWQESLTDTRTEQTNRTDRMEKHSVTYTYETKCTRCGEYSLRTAVDYVAHSYNQQGMCACGHVQVSEESPCDHATSGVQVGNASYLYLDAERHAKMTTMRYQCECGKVNETREESVWMAHSYNQQGMCACGHVQVNQESPCDHATSGVQVGSASYLYLDAERHAKMTTMRYQCECGKVNETREERVWAPHSYTNGACVCGAKQSAAATVPPAGHTHQYQEKVLNIRKYHLSEAHQHYVVETYCSKCLTCGDQTAQQERTRAEAHQWGSVQGEGDHPHAKYQRCACGYVKYLGSNSTELPASQCCICKGHQYGEPAQQGSSWSRQCTRCGKVQMMSKAWVQEHEAELRRQEQEEAARREAQALRNHKAEAIQKNQLVKNFAQIDDLNDTTWVRLANEAIKLNQDGKYVYFNESLKAMKDAGGAITAAVMGTFLEGEQDPEVLLWLELLNEMFAEGPQAIWNPVGDYNKHLDVAGTMSDGVADLFGKQAGYIKQNLDMKTGLYNLELRDLTANGTQAEVDDLMAYYQAYADKANKTAGNLQDASDAFGNTMENLGKMETLGKIVESVWGHEAAQRATQQELDAYATILLDYANNMAMLDSVEKHLDSPALQKACGYLRNELQLYYTDPDTVAAYKRADAAAKEQTRQMLSATIEGIIDMGIESVFGIVEMASMVTDGIGQWTPAYESGLEMQLLATLDGSISGDVMDALENQSISADEIAAVLSLYSVLQNKGNITANEFLQLYDRSGFNSVEDFGTGLGLNGLIQNCAKGVTTSKELLNQLNEYRAQVMNDRLLCAEIPSVIVKEEHGYTGAFKDQPNGRDLAGAPKVGRQLPVYGAVIDEQIRLWYYVECDGQLGFIRAKDVDITAEDKQLIPIVSMQESEAPAQQKGVQLPSGQPVTGVYVKTTQPANIRSAPGAACDLVLSVGMGKTLKVIERQVPSLDGTKAWYLVEVDGCTGYVSSGVVEIVR